MVNKAGIYRLASIACIMVAAAAVTGKSDACTRAVYLGPDNMIVTGRTMDWKEDPQSNIYFFPRGMERRGVRPIIQLNGHRFTAVW